MSNPNIEISGPPFFFIADDVALDFVNTLAAPSGTLVDLVESPARFLDWLALVPDLSAMLDLAREAERRGELHTAVSEARSLRDWLIDALPRLKAGGDVLQTVDMTPLNRALGAGASYWSTSPEGGKLEMKLMRRYNGPLSVIVPLAEAMAVLLTRVDPAVIRKCENPKCVLWFRDTTKRGHRRWCSAAACGNRAKVAAHRQRLRSNQI